MMPEFHAYDAAAGPRSSQKIARIPGYYCLFDTEFDRELVSFWSGRDWQFLGTLHLTRDDARDAGGKLVMENYVVGDRIREPHGARRF